MGESIPVELKCCAGGPELVLWREANSLDGPERAGWCIGTPGPHDATWVLVRHCPFCGHLLEVAK